MNTLSLLLLRVWRASCLLVLGPALLAPTPLLAQQPDQAKYHVFAVESGSFSDHHVFLGASDLSWRRAQADDATHLSDVIDFTTGTSDRKVFGPAVLDDSVVPPNGGSLVYPAIGNPRLTSSTGGQGERRVPVYTLTGEMGADGWRTYATTGWTATLRDSVTGKAFDVTSYLRPVRKHRWYLKTAVELPRGWSPGLYDLSLRIPDSTGPAVYLQRAQHAVSVLPAFRSPYKFAVLSDIHVGSPILSQVEPVLCVGDARGSKDYHVADLASLFDHLAEYEKPDFVVITGDFVNGCNLLWATTCYDRQYQAFKWALLQSKLPVFITPGNHDQGWPGSSRHTAAFRRWINPAFDSGGEDADHLDDFSFDHLGDHFVVADSGYGGNELDGLNGAQLRWMQDDTAAAGLGRTFFFSHAPVVTTTLGGAVCGIPGENMSHESPNDYHFADWILNGPGAPKMAAFIAGHTHKAEAYVIRGLSPGPAGDEKIVFEPTDRVGTRDTSGPNDLVLVSASATYDGGTDNPHAEVAITSPGPGDAVTNPVAVAGTASDPSGSLVWVELSGDGGFTWATVALASGAWSGTVDPTRGDVIMARAVRVLSGGLSSVAFVRVTPSTYTLSGTVSSASSGVVVCANSRCTTTDAAGRYAITGLLGGAYAVTPRLAGFTFSPASRPVTIDGSDATGIDFKGHCGACGKRSVSGSVSPALAGVTVSAGALGALTDASGSYRIYGLAEGTYSVTPAKECWPASGPGYAFSPPYRTVTLQKADATGQDFAAAEITYGVSGNVSPALAGVEVCADVACATTDASGDYAITGLSNGSYTLTATKPSYVFEPATRPLTIACGAVAGQDFAGRPAYLFSETFDAPVDPGKWQQFASGNVNGLSLGADGGKLKVAFAAHDFHPWIGYAGLQSVEKVRLVPGSVTFATELDNTQNPGYPYPEHDAVVALSAAADPFPGVSYSGPTASFRDALVFYKELSGNRGIYDAVVSIKGGAATTLYVRQDAHGSAPETRWRVEFLSSDNVRIYRNEELVYSSDSFGMGFAESYLYLYQFSSAGAMRQSLFDLILVEGR